MEILWMLGLFAVSAGIFGMSRLAARVDAQIEASRNWPSAMATIESSRVMTSKSTHYPVIKYSYEAEGRQYRGARYAFGSWSGTREQVNALVEAMSPGARVPVYYDRNKPGFAVIERTGQSNTYRIVGWVMGGVFFLLFVVMVLNTAKLL